MAAVSPASAEVKNSRVEKGAEAPEERVATLEGSTAKASDELPIGRIMAPATVAASAELTEENPEAKDAPPTEPGFDQTAASRVSRALAQPAKERVAPPPVVKRPARRVAAAVAPRRARPTTTAAKATTANTKVDCRQPFWVDERGIRRLKMACL